MLNKQKLLLLSCLCITTACSGTKPELGIVHGRLSDCPTTANCVCSQASGEKWFIEPIRIRGTQAEARARALDALNHFARTRIIAANDDYIRAEVSSLLFRFVDDLELYFPATGAPEITVHVRSASRIGKSDLGVNRRRVEKIRRLLKKNQLTARGE